jgi:hypothetical protein
MEKEDGKRIKYSRTALSLSVHLLIAAGWLDYSGNILKLQA